jgi:hypothetical protein
MNSERNDNIICPFWSTESKKCRVCNGGLFIPLDEHIVAYCTSIDHHYCLQYSLHTPKSEQTRNDAINRRQSQRVELTNQIQILKLIKSGEVIQQFEENAETLDVSSIGMRLHTVVPLVNDTVIQFSFNDTFPEPLKSGAGLVEWCTKQPDALGYHAGISFQSKGIIDAMDNLLKTATKNI